MFKTSYYENESQNELQNWGFWQVQILCYLKMVSWCKYKIDNFLHKVFDQGLTFDQIIENVKNISFSFLNNGKDVLKNLKQGCCGDTFCYICCQYGASSI